MNEWKERKYRRPATWELCVYKRWGFSQVLYMYFQFGVCCLFKRLDSTGPPTITTILLLFFIIYPHKHTHTWWSTIRSCATTTTTTILGQYKRTDEINGPDRTLEKIYIIDRFITKKNQSSTLPFLQIGRIMSYLLL